MSFIFSNTANIAIADMVFVDFGHVLNQHNTSVSKITMTFECLKKLKETVDQIIFDVDTKIAEAAKSKN